MGRSGKESKLNDYRKIMERENIEIKLNEKKQTQWEICSLLIDSELCESGINWFDERDPKSSIPLIAM